MKKTFLTQMITIGIVTSIIITTYSVPASAAWIQDTEKKWNWIEDDVQAKGWKQINDNWYHFDENGAMNTGWFNDNEKWYNLSDDGTMNIGWKQIGDQWYYFDEHGIMNTGWLQQNDNWYFINHNGQMETGTIEVNGIIYTFSESGIMQNNNETIKNIETTGSEENKDANLEQPSDTITSTSEERKGYVNTNSDSLNIRSSASISASIIGSLSRGSEITIIGKEKDGFYHINENGAEGWVSVDWISFEKIPPFTENSNDDGGNDNPAVKNDSPTLNSDSIASVGIRNVQPSLDDKHYYSDDNVFYKAKLSPPFNSSGRTIRGNCTWYAWGRAWEITGVKPIEAGFLGNAYEWWEANKSSGKYQYGSEPRVGSIAVWKTNLPGSGGFGHVAVVEKIDNGKTYISESMWHGDCFKYGEIYETGYLYGYIYLDKPNY